MYAKIMGPALEARKQLAHFNEEHRAGGKKSWKIDQSLEPKWRMSVGKLKRKADREALEKRIKIKDLKNTWLKF